MRRPIGCLLLGIIALASASVAAAPGTLPTIDWDPSTLRCLEPGGCYARIVRDGKQLLCCYELHSHIWVRASQDDGKTWLNPVDAAGYEHGYAANPELLVCPDRILLFYNGRPRDGQHPFAICQARSSDHGRSWTSAAAPIFTAAPVAAAGCYEPAPLLRSDGSIDLFFANEFPYASSAGRATFQEITVVHSHDAGQSWSQPATACYRTAGRDGMPVPLLLADQLLLAIEDNGLLDDHILRPMLVSLPAALASTAPPTPPRRWNPLSVALSRGVYGGAPYLRQFPDGTTALSFQTGDPAGRQHAAVYLGDATAHHFVAQRPPYTGDVDSKWNSIFIKNPSTLLLISTAQINGTYGIWTIDGHLQPADLQDASGQQDSVEIDVPQGQ